MDERPRMEPPADETGGGLPGAQHRQSLRMTQRWKAVDHQVETAEGTLHVATTSHPHIAAHIATLHNRTFGDGQDPPDRPLDPNPAVPLHGNTDARAWAEEFHLRHRAGMPTDAGTLIGWFANAIQTGVDSVRNEGVAEDFLAGSAADEQAQVEAALANAAQDYAEGVAGAGPCMDYLRLGLPRGPLRRDSIRQAFLAGYGKASARRDEPAAYPGTAAFLARLAEVPPPGRPAAEEPVDEDGARRDFHARLGRMVDGEIQRRVTDYAAREPARIVIDGSPNAMAWTLSKLGYVVRTPEEAEQDRKDRLAPPTVEVRHAGGSNGVELVVNGEAVLHLNDGDTGGAGITLAARALCHALGISLVDFGEVKG